MAGSDGIVYNVCRIEDREGNWLRYKIVKYREETGEIDRFARSMGELKQELRARATDGAVFRSFIDLKMYEGAAEKNGCKTIMRDDGAVAFTVDTSIWAMPLNEADKEEISDVVNIG